MKKLLALLLGLSISTTAIAEPAGDFQTISIEDGLDRNERRVREAAVKITEEVTDLAELFSIMICS